MDTIAAAITPIVSAPVITLRISGSQALKVYDVLTSSCGLQTKVSSVIPNRISKYVFHTDDGLTDDVMAVYFKAPKSFTGEDVVEISFHGNPLLIRSAFSTLFRLGCRPALPGEFSRRAFLNGKMDLTQAEAVQELISAKTDKGVYHAYEQLAGSVRKELDFMKRSLLELKAVIEAKIDFPDEDTVDDILPAIKKSISSVASLCGSLLGSYQNLRSKPDKIKIVIAGKPNTGKSSILNALLNEDRAIVSPVAGTTRDFIKEDLFLGKIPAEIVDTAGVRESSDGLEALGIKKTFEKISSADITVVVVDLSSPMDGDDDKVLLETETLRRIIVGNKSDEGTFRPDFADVIVSAKTGANIDTLKSLIKEKIASIDITDDSANTVPVTERHYFLLKEAAEALKTVMENIDSMALDMVAFDVDFVLSKFQEITGEKYTEQVLDIIFSKFCIGK